MINTLRTTTPRKSVAVLVLAIVSTVAILAQARTAGATASLAGEQFNWAGKSFNGNFACSGNTHFDYSIYRDGVALGPYPGVFTESGHVTLSGGSVSAWSTQFTVKDPGGSVTVQGTSSLAAGGGGTGACVDNALTAPGTGNATANLDYTATISSETATGHIASSLNYVFQNDSPAGSTLTEVFDAVTVPAGAIPSTAATEVPPANSNGWSNTPVTVSLTASDADGLSDVAEVDYSAIGAQPLGATRVLGHSTSVTISNEGITTLRYFAQDLEGNTEVAKTIDIRVDLTPPHLDIDGNSSTYQLDDNVHISCSASDPTGAVVASGIDAAHTSCHDIVGPAYLFPGITPFQFTASDLAGNTVSAVGSFTVLITVTGLCNLTNRFVEGSHAYQVAPALVQLGVRMAIQRACLSLALAHSASTAALKSLYVQGYRFSVSSFLYFGFLQPDQATILSGLAGGI